MAKRLLSMATESEVRRGSRAEQQRPERLPPSRHAAPDYQPVRDLRERLPLAIEVLNAAGVLLFPAHPRPLSRSLRHLLLENHDAQRHAAAARRMDSSDVVVTTIGGLRIAFSGFTEAQETLCVAQPEEAAATDADAEYLRHVVARLAANRAPEELRELMALEQLLAQAASGGVERDVVAAFVEAAAVWQDLEARSYVANDRGVLVSEVALPGQPAGNAPDVLAQPARALPPAPHVAIVDGELWGFTGAATPLFVVLTEAGVTPRVIAVMNAHDAAARAALSMYEPVLRRMVRSAAEAESSRLIWALMQTLVADADSLKQPLAAAAAELSQRAVWTVGITVDRRDGARIVDVTPDAARATDRGAERFSCVLALPDGFVGSLEVGRPAGHPFTAREHRLADTAAGLLSTWLSAALRGGRFGRDRRAATSTFEEQLTKHAEIVTGQPMSAIVFGPPSTVAAARYAVGEIRRQLRPFDAAGTLATGEIGILLRQSSAERARHVVERLRKSFAKDTVLGAVAATSVGVASADTSDESAIALFEAARERARAADEAGE